MKTNWGHGQLVENRAEDHYTGQVLHAVSVFGVRMGPVDHRGF
ncbi:hypothetical protein [Dokdonella sp.]